MIAMKPNVPRSRCFLRKSLPWMKVRKDLPANIPSIVISFCTRLILSSISLTGHEHFQRSLSCFLTSISSTANQCSERKQ